jgi:hypothetical protein
VTTKIESLRGRLVAELVPVEPLAEWRAWLVTAIVLAAAMVVIAMGLSVRSDFVALQPHPVAVARSGTLLLLGAISGAAAIASARPTIGGIRRNWQAVLAAAMLFPLAAIVRIATDPSGAMRAIASPSASECLTVSLTVALAVATVLTGWLRRGAPASPERSGLLAGLAAGALGGFAYSIRCPYNDLAYIGVWYPLVVTIAALVGRLLISRFVRW